MSPFANIDKTLDGKGWLTAEPLTLGPLARMCT
jgi:hypothetical protein